MRWQPYAAQFRAYCPSCYMFVCFVFSVPSPLLSVPQLCIAPLWEGAAACGCVAAASCGSRWRRSCGLGGGNISGWSNAAELPSEADLQNAYMLLINPSLLIQVIQRVTKPVL